MKTRKNLMLLVLLSLFLSVGVADSNVTDVNTTVEVEDPFAGLEEAFNEFDKAIEEEKRSKEKLLAKQEEEKKWTEEEKRSEESLAAAQEKYRQAVLAAAAQ